MFASCASPVLSATLSPRHNLTPLYSRDVYKNNALKNRKKIRKIKIGTPKSRVYKIMGTKSFSGSTNESVTITNPYKTKEAQLADGLYEILYYYTRAINDGAITDEELTPVILHDDKVVGIGEDFLDIIGVKINGGNLKDYEKDITNENSAKKPGKVFAGKDSRTYHKEDCDVISNIEKDELVKFGSSDDAANSGGKPCEVCKP